MLSRAMRPLLGRMLAPTARDAPELDIQRHAFPHGNTNGSGWMIHAPGLDAMPYLSALFRDYLRSGVLQCYMDRVLSHLKPSEVGQCKGNPMIRNFEPLFILLVAVCGIGLLGLWAYTSVMAFADMSAHVFVR